MRPATAAPPPTSSAPPSQKSFCTSTTISAVRLIAGLPVGCSSPSVGRRTACRVAETRGRRAEARMEHVQVFALVITAVAVTAGCRKRGWPAPLVLVGVAIAVSLIPGVPRYEIDPRLLLEFVL